MIPYTGIPYTVLDTETTIRNKGEDAVGTFEGSPFSVHNYIVALGELNADGFERLDYDAAGVRKLPMCIRRARAGVRTMLVCHHGGFDICYLLKTWPEEMEEALPFLYIWDTQQVEYLLSGQSDLYPSLDGCCEKRGLPLKDDKIKQYWNDRVDTPFIPKEELLDYLHGDLTNTHEVFLDQWERVQANPALRELVYVKMDDILCTTHMEWNGMKFDLQRAYEKLEKLEARRAELEVELVLALKCSGFFPQNFDLNVGSNDQISLFLFGGKGKYKGPVVLKDDTGEPLRYKGGQKAGQIKTRIETIEFKVKGLGFKPKKLDIPQLKNSNWSTDSEHLAKIDHPFVKALIEWRELNKDAETYYRGYSSVVWFDGCIHPLINHESTRTGRQSSSSPNLQNVTKDDE